jgi:uncharacterized membrane protein
LVANGPRSLFDLAAILHWCLEIEVKGGLSIVCLGITLTLYSRFS